MNARALLALVLFCGSVYYADDFANAFGLRALPFGALGVLLVCLAVARPQPAK